MTQPTECKYCGCEQVATKTDSAIAFRCWSSYVVEDDNWFVSNNCGARCAVQLVELRERVQQAVEVLDYITVEDWEERARDAFEILRGEVPEPPDSSPVTADRSATEDYYEAVRKRVPWMVAVEHIVGLVEGYRQCGLTASQTAKEIQRVYGSKR